MNGISSHIVEQLADLGIVGSSDVILRAGMLALQAAPTDLTVLLTGESGSGKEVFAKAIHRMSKRKRLPLVSVNCGAIPETLLEAELFGNERGAFTGAVEQRKGFFEAAHKATIFLDEIGEMPITTQVKLLRILESGEYSRLGSSEVRVCDVRVIAATNRNLEERVANGEFRRDLFYRLNAVRIELPSLAERREDIPELVLAIAHMVSEQRGITYKGMSDSALQILQELPFEGNVRELKNIIEAIVTLEHGEFITREILMRYLPKQSTQSSYSYRPAPNAMVHLPNRTAEQVERELLYKALLDVRGEIMQMRQELREIRERLGIRDFVLPVPDYTQTPPDTTMSSSTTAIVPASGEYAFVPAVPSFMPAELHEENPSSGDTHALSHEQSGEAIDAEHEVVLHDDTELHTNAIASKQDDMIFRLDDIEKMMILRAIAKFHGNRRVAADALGISERTLYRKLNEYGIE